jgi:hypothetical protein
MRYAYIWVHLRIPDRMDVHAERTTGGWPQLEPAAALDCERRRLRAFSAEPGAEVGEQRAAIRRPYTARTSLVSTAVEISLTRQR